jgi:hypothetical protein
MKDLHDEDGRAFSKSEIRISKLETNPNPNFKTAFVLVVCILEIRACFACPPVGRNFVLQISTFFLK